MSSGVLTLVNATRGWGRIASSGQCGHGAAGGASCVIVGGVVAEQWVAPVWSHGGSVVYDWERSGSCDREQVVETDAQWVRKREMGEQEVGRVARMKGNGRGQARRRCSFI